MEKEFKIKPQMPKIVCADGFTMSVQASQFHYSTPRNDEGPYSAVEVGFPNMVEPLLMEWVEDPEKPTQTVYPWVPVDVIHAVIAKHGGTKNKLKFRTPTVLYIS